MNKIFAFISGHRARIIIAAIAVMTVVASTLFPLHLEWDSTGNGVIQLGQGSYKLTIGNQVNAMSANYTCDGVNDDLEFQQALNALPSIGGQLFILAGQYTFNATVTRAIDNVSIVGVGGAVSIENNGATALFQAGGDKWFFSNFQVDAGNITISGTDDWLWINLWVGTDHYQMLPSPAADLAAVEAAIAALEADMSTAQSDISTLQSTVSGHTSDISTLQSDVSSLQSSMSTAQSDISTLQSSMSTAQGDISTLESQMSGALSDISTLQSDMSTAQSDISTLQSSMSTAQGDISTLESQMSGALSDISTLQSTVSGHTSDISTLQSDVSSLQSTVSGISSNVTALQSTVSGISSNVTALQSTVSGLVSDLATLQADFTAHLGDFNAHGEQCPLYPANIGCLIRDSRHQGLNVALFHIDGGNKTVIAYRDSSKHASSGADSEILAVDTYDMGITLTNSRTIYDDASATIDTLNGAYAVMDDDRFGWLMSRRTTDTSTWDDPVFVYSDDEGETWDFDILTGMSHAHFNFDIIRYPTSVGGDDDGGWLAVGSVLVDASNTKLVAFYTTDNGDNWSEADLISSATLGAGEYACESTISRIGTDDKWVMLWRRHQGHNLNAYASNSSDLFTWATPVDTGQVLGDNPPYLMQYGDNLVWFAASRYRDGVIPPITGQPGNTYLFQVADADAIWDDLTDWPGWTPLASVPNYLTGYMTVRDIEGVYYGIFCADGYNNANIYIMSRNPGITHTMEVKISDGDKTIYIDKDASGANDGTSWDDAFESWADCQAWLAGWTIAHDWTILVRNASTPYREIFEMTGFSVWGSLTVQGEFYWNGDCESQATAGNIKDTTADFDDVEVGDHVFILDLNGANGRVQDYEVCTVDDISQAGSGIIGTDGSDTATTGWDYTIVKTEISGSDTGADGGTARAYCASVVTQNNIYIQGFYMTFTDDYSVYVENSGNINVDYCIMDECDRGLGLAMGSIVYSDYIYSETTDRYSLLVGETSFAYCNYWALYTNASYAACIVWRNSAAIMQYFYTDQANQAFLVRDAGWCYPVKGTISSNSAIGLQAVGMGVIQTGYLTNNGVDAEDPDSTTDPSYIY